MRRLTTRSAFVLLGAVVASVTLAAGQDAAVTLRAAREAETISGDLTRAASLYQQAAEEAGSDRATTAQALLGLGRTYLKLDRPDAPAVLGRVVSDFADQPRAVAAATSAMRQELTPRRWDHSEEFPFSFTPDGRSAFVVRNSAPHDLVVQDLFSGQERTVVAGQGRSVGRWPMGSPDGRQVAFSWLARGPMGTGTGTDALQVVGLEPGATPRQLSPAVRVSQLIPTGWSADSREILVKRAGPGGGWGASGGALAWVSAADGTNRTIRQFEDWRSVGTGGFFGPASVRVSPDSNWIAFTATATEGSSDSYIFTISADGSRETAAITLSGRNTHPTWTPNGQHLLFVNERASDRGLWAVRMNGGAPAGEPFLVQGKFAGTIVDMSRAGDLFYLTTDSDFRFWEFVTIRNGSTTVERTFSGQSGVWSSTNELAFFRGAGESRELIVRDMATGQERTHRREGLTNVSPLWFSDGRAMIVHVDAGPGDGAGSEFYRLDTATGEFARMFPRDTDDAIRSSVMALSPDDTTLYAVSRSREPQSSWRRLVAIDVATGDERVVTTFPGDGLPSRSDPSLAVSPDGQTLAIKAWDSGQTAEQSSRINTVRIDGSGYREVHGPIGTGGWASVLQWTPDGQSLLFVDRSVSSDRWRIMRVPAAGGTAVPDGLDSAELADHDHPPAGIANFDLSPDGTRLVFGASTATLYDLWTLDNVLWVVSRR